MDSIDSNEPLKVSIGKGAAMLICSTFCIALSSGFIHLAGDLPALQKQLVRSAVMIILTASTVIKDRDELKIKKAYAAPLLLRGLMGAIACSCNFYSIDHLPLATANMLAKLAPFFTVIFAYLFLKEKLRLRNILALVAAFTGVIFAVGQGDKSVELFPVFMGIMSGLFGGAAFTSLRACNKAGAPNGITVLSFSVATLLVSVPTTVYDYHYMTIDQIMILAVSGLVATVGHFCISRAYRYAPPSKVAVFDYCQIVWSAIIGFIMFGQIPGLFSVVGYSVIIGTGVVIFLIEEGIISIH